MVGNKRDNRKRVTKRKTGRIIKDKRQYRPTIVTFKSGLPREMFMKLQYFENNYVYSLTNVDKLQYTRMRLNDPRDPYTGVGGKSALYFDFWIQAFRYLRVMAAKITVTWNKVSDVNQAVIFALVPNFALSLWTDMDDPCSQPYTKTSRTYVNRVGDSSSLSYYIPIHRLLNMSKLQYDSQLPGSTYDVTYNSSPTSNAAMDILIGRVNENDTTTISGAFTVSIKFYCKLYQRYNFVETGSDVDEVDLDADEVAKIDALPDYVLPIV